MERIGGTEIIQHEVTVWRELDQTPHTLEFLDVAGVQTRVLRAGDGPPLVFVHGTGGHLEAYARNVGPLAESFTVVVYDMLGHGFTDRPDFPYTIDVLSDHLCSLLETLGYESVFLSGESLGGWVAAWTAAHHPRRVRKLILNTPGNIANKPEVMERVKASTLLAAREPTEGHVRERLEWLFYDKTFVTAELVAIRQSVYQQADFPRTAEHICALQDPDVRKDFAWSPDWCGRIEAETLLLWTDHDPTGGLDEADLLLEWIPRSRLQVITDAGHWPQWEKPAEFNQAHHDFLLGQ